VEVHWLVANLLATPAPGAAGQGPAAGRQAALSPVLTVFRGRRMIPGAGPRRGGREVGVIAMRRLGVIVALGALLSMFGGVVTASPALARGPKWQFQPKSPMTLPAALCGFEVRVTPLVNREFAKILKASDGSMIVLYTGAVIASYTNLETGKTITENVSGPAKITFFGSCD
jgi:hypothetical protein